MYNKILHRFLSNNRALLSRTRTSFANLHLRIFKKKANFLLLFEYGYMRSNSARLGEYPTHRDVADMSNLFYFHFESIWSRRMTRLPSFHLSKRNGLNKNRYKHFSLARRKLYVSPNLTILTGKNCVLFNLEQEWLVGCFWPFWYIYTIN